MSFELFNRNKPIVWAMDNHSLFFAQYPITRNN